MGKKYDYYKNNKVKNSDNDDNSVDIDIDNNNDEEVIDDREEENEEEIEDDNDEGEEIRDNNYNYRNNKKKWSNDSNKTGWESSKSSNFTEVKIGKCPECRKGDVVVTERAYSCNRWREGCKFAIWKNSFEKLSGKPITKKMAISLLNGEKVNLGKMISIRTGKEFEPMGVLQKDKEYGWKIQFIFE